MRKIVRWLVIVFLGILFLVNVLTLSKNTISLIPSIYAKEECHDGWLEVKDIIRCHCPYSEKRCECCFEEL